MRQHDLLSLLASSSFPLTVTALEVPVEAYGGMSSHSAPARSVEFQSVANGRLRMYLAHQLETTWHLY